MEFRPWKLNSLVVTVETYTVIIAERGEDIQERRIIGWKEEGKHAWRRRAGWSLDFVEWLLFPLASQRFILSSLIATLQSSAPETHFLVITTTKTAIPLCGSITRLRRGFLYQNDLNGEAHRSWQAIADELSTFISYFPWSRRHPL